MQSTSAATLAGSGVAQAEELDAPVSLGAGSAFPDGSAPVENAFVLEGASTTHQYGWGDSVIPSQVTLGVPPVNLDGSPNFSSKGEVRAIAEANVNSGARATGNSSGSSVSGFDAEVQVSTGGRLRFDFEAAHRLMAEIVLPDTGVRALGRTTVSITLRDSGGSLVYLWEGGSSSFGGAGNYATVSPYNFSASASVSQPGSIGPISESFASFSDVTDDLAVGAYELSLSLVSLVEVQGSVPVPGTLALIGLGLLGASGLSRRNRKLQA